MDNVKVAANKWDGQLPPHIAKNEQMWWEVFPRIKADMPPSILQIFGTATESPSRETVGKVVFVAGRRQNLRRKYGALGGSLLNCWGCYCTLLNFKDYMAGTATEPHLTFSVPIGVFEEIYLRFLWRIKQNVNGGEFERNRIDQSIKARLKEMGVLEECVMSVVKFNHGLWENGLDMTFKASIWVNANEDEALSNIWKIKIDSDGARFIG